MRLFVMAGLVGAALATPASACPRGTLCITMRSAPSAVPAVRSKAPKKAPKKASAVAATLSLSIPPAGPVVPVDRHARLDLSLSSFEPTVARADEREVPWIWAVLAERGKRHLPRYDPSHQFSMVFSPVVVSMPTESRPGFGVSGGF